jgi:predicted SprT family Zn-dependent metalloprotease
MTDREEDALIERLREEEALQRALASYTCACGAHYPKAYDIVRDSQESDTAYRRRHVKCRFCKGTGKVLPLKKSRTTLPITQEDAPDAT